MLFNKRVLDASQVLFENQRCAAFELVFSSLKFLLEIFYKGCLFFNLNLQISFKDMDKVGLFILTGQLSEKVFLYCHVKLIFYFKFSCIIPSICFLVFWLYRIDKCLILDDVLKHYRIFELLVLIGNRLNLLRQRRTLCDLRVFSEVEDPNKGSINLIPKV